MGIHHSPSPSKRGKAENPGNFPEWLLFEVLMRVPFESLRVLKLVSKQWNRTISDPYFTRAYVDRLSSRTQCWSLISGFAEKVSLTYLLCGNKPDTRSVNLSLITGRNREGKSPSHRTLVGSSNGLLLYGHLSEEASRHKVLSYEICNPVTGQIQRITTVPPPRHDYDVVGTGFVTRIEQDVLKSFRVVRVNVHQENSGSTMFDVYSSETRAWECHMIPEKIDFCKWRYPVVVGETLHWMIVGYRVAAYDPYDNPGSVCIFRLPSHDDAIDTNRLKQLGMRDALFDQHEGRLRFTKAKHVAQGNRQWTDISVWVLNDFMSGMWSLQHRARIEGLKALSLPLCFNPSDPNVIYVINVRGFHSYDFGTGKLRVKDGSKRVCIHHACTHLTYGMSYFLFVTPPCPSLFDPRVLSSDN